MIQNKEELKQIDKMKVKDIQKVIYEHNKDKCDILHFFLTFFIFLQILIKFSIN